MEGMASQGIAPTKTDRKPIAPPLFVAAATHPTGFAPLDALKLKTPWLSLNPPSLQNPYSSPTSKALPYFKALILIQLQKPLPSLNLYSLFL
jgi:hypothetical protein